MKFSKTFIPTLREVPADAVIASHQLMFRAAMLRKLSNGLFAYLPLGLRAFRKVQAIVRSEMDAIDAIEIRPPVVVPGEIWKESGRWDSMGEGMLRLKNRLGGDFVISPTAEEAVTAILRDELSSYRQLPITLYQINTKYRDEIRPRYGVMRGREFTMKDAYSYHADAESLDQTYQAMGGAYRRIFKRCGLSVIPVQADTGAMGGTGSEEFMIESSIGDNTLLLCSSCDYAANVEKAICKPDFENILSLDDVITRAKETAALKPIDTPNVRSIEELCAFLQAKPTNFIKTLVYRAENVERDLSALPAYASAAAPLAAPLVYDEIFIAVCIRGDLEVNDTKLAALLKAGEVSLASEADVERLTGAPLGFAGPVGLKNLGLICDQSVLAMQDAITGGLARDLHLEHVAYGRDFVADIVDDVRTVVAGDNCAHCGDALYEKKGNELGHIFKLGYKYTKSMGVSFLDINGKSQTPIMGCYGIGIDRTLASIIEDHHDDNGIIWPMSVAPFQVCLVPIKYDGPIKEKTDALYKALTEAGIEVLLDDRNERPGVKFKDMDLIGIPLRVVIGDKNLPKVEFKLRAQKEGELIDYDDILEHCQQAIARELAELRGN